MAQAILTSKQALALPMQDNDAGAGTVREYLATLLHLLWDEQEGFNGKRPFGNSGWDYDIYRALIAGGALAGTYDDKVGAHINDYRQARILVRTLIEEMCGVS